AGLSGIAGVSLILSPNEPYTPFLSWVFGFVVLLTFVFLGHAIYVSNQRLKLSVVDDGLRVEKSTLLGTTHQFWLRSRITDVRVGYYLLSRVPRQARQIVCDSGSLRWELQIHLAHGAPVGFLDGYPVRELQWVATLLRRELGLRQPHEPAHVN